ncbi:MAG: CBS domain-containing protein [Thermodesulfobacteria bacterium]|nr:CBS domain-containing protein [Thermodesulfobacteriota bacterium]
MPEENKDLWLSEAVKKRLEAAGKANIFPYHAQVQEIMVSPVFTCPSQLSVRQVAKEMARRQISSAVVVDERERPAGIITERDLLTKVVSRETVDPDRTPAAAIMSAPAITISPKDKVYRALSLLSRYGIKHLPVVEDGRVVGIVTLRHLLRMTHQEPLLIIGRIELAQSPRDLAEVKADLPAMAANRLSAGISAVDTMTMLSLIHQDIHRRAFEMAVEQMGEEPPVPFCLFVTGSHGRGEALLAPDQDHGLIIADYPDSRFNEIDGYFRELAVKFGQILEEIGYPRCSGYIMSENPLWRKRYSEWLKQFVIWLELSSYHTVRYLTLVFDASPLLGDFSLFYNLKQFMLKEIQGYHNVIRQMFEEEAGHKVPLGMFKNFIVEKDGPHKGQLHLKRSGLIFVVEAARVLCLKEGIGEVGTLERIEALKEKHVLSAQDAEYAEHAFHLLVHYALDAQVRHWQRGEPISYWINPKELSAHDQDMLRYAFQAVKRLKDLVEAAFGHVIL